MDIESNGSSAQTIALKSLDALQGLVGCEFRSAHQLTMEQHRIRAFAQATDDLQWIHVDVDRAVRESPYKAPIAHGFLTLSLLSSFMADALRFDPATIFAVNYGLGKVRFPAPVRVGDRIRGRFLLQSLEQTGEGWHATYLATIDLDGGTKPCCVAEWLVRYYSVSKNP